MKSNHSFDAIARTSIREYLLELQESGVEGIPVEAVRSPDIIPPQAVVSVAGQAAPSDNDVRIEPKHESLEKIRKSLGDCERCKLSKTRTNLVFGVGNPQARILFAGEGPAADEDRLGEPFVGEAGQILNRIISAMGLRREDVYICNVVKCRPPKNRDPETDEIAACSPFLHRQIRSIAPEVIVALGKIASHALLDTSDPISRLRGRFRDFNGIPLMPTYHPSHLLHRQKEGSKESSKEAFWDVWEDMVQVLQFLKMPVPEKIRPK